MNRYISNTLSIFFLVQTINAFQMAPPSRQHHRSFTQSSAARYTGSPLAAKNGNEEGSVEEYKNAATSILSKFMQSSDMKNGGERPKDPLGDIDFEAPKVRKMNLDALASMLDAELYEKEWFVTGQVNPSFFAEDFEFQDPDVKLSGIEDYARGVYKLFDQDTSRAEIISTEVNQEVPNTITVTWRLSGAVNIGPGLKIKPYICYTDFTVNENGLISFQEDRFDIPGWDILLSALFPFLIGKVTAPPAPPVPSRGSKSDQGECVTTG